MTWCLVDENRYRCSVRFTANPVRCEGAPVRVDLDRDAPGAPVLTMKPIFIVLLACVAAAALTGGALADQSAPEGTATTATENPDSPDSGSVEVDESTPQFTPEPSYRRAQESTPRSSASTANVTAVATLDNKSVVTDYRMADGVMKIDVLVEEETTISATERIEKDGAYEVRFQEWSDLQPGNHTLTFDTMSNESASLMMYSRRGIENGRAVQLQISEESGYVSGLDESDPYVVGLTVALILGAMFLAEAVRRKFALGEGGERLV